MSELIKYHHSPIWKVEETEQWLREMEESGWRLVKVSLFGWKYHFKQSKPKSVQYFFGTSEGKKKEFFWTTDMLPFYMAMKSVYQANEIPKTWSAPLWLYRITMDADLTFEKDTRLLYLRNQAIENVVSAIVFCLYFAMLLFLAYVGLPLLFWIVLPVYSILFGSWIGYAIFGLAKTARRVREFNKRNRRK